MVRQVLPCEHPAHRETSRRGPVPSGSHARRWSLEVPSSHTSCVVLRSW